MLLLILHDSLTFTQTHTHTHLPHLDCLSISRLIFFLQLFSAPSGYPAAAIRLFCDRMGVSKSDNNIDMSVLEDCVRDTLGTHLHSCLSVSTAAYLLALPGCLSALLAS